jgi:trk system potassium uptake protein TrkA
MAAENSARFFLVIGLGTFGSHVARALYEGGAQVLAIDQDETAAQAMMNDATRVICANALDEEALRVNGAFDADCAIVAVRRRFDSTVLITHMLKKRGIREILVLVDSSLEESAVLAIGATQVIFPERDMAGRLARSLLMPDLADQIPLGTDVGIVSIPCPNAFVGRSLIELDIRKNDKVSVIAIAHNPTMTEGKAVVSPAPNPEIPLKATDTLFVLGRTKELTAFKEKYGPAE